ncbi:MAG TPA: dihydrolipoamide acetyltransferase family protein [Jatrophihabitantaceae bacterium]|nr:dihydrolipoamide acetyltransferase family protein [Jatrophihabitantaceae bacterium]
MPDFLLPDLGEGLTEAEIIRWLVGIGDQVAVDQPVVEVETAKATVELPSPFSGTVQALHGATGDSVSVGAALLTVEAATPADGGPVLVGYGISDSAGRAKRSCPARERNSSTPPRAGVISPLVRRLAHDHGVDVRQVRGSGPDGIVLRHDVESVIARKAPDAGESTRAQSDSGPRTIPLRGARRTAVDRLSRSRREIPEATVWVDVDATELLTARAELNANPDATPVSIIGLLARFAIAGLGRYPELNSRVEADRVVLLDRVNLGFAAQTDHGLVVPVVQDAQQLTTRSLSAVIARLTASARSGSLTPRELTGGTFTVNNYGIFGVDGSAAIINYPEVAILGLGRIMPRPWVVDGELRVRQTGQLNLAFDHRACDGGVAGGFLRYVADCVESPVRVLADL